MRLLPAAKTGGLNALDMTLISNERVAAQHPVCTHASGTPLHSLIPTIRLCRHCDAHERGEAGAVYGVLPLP